MHRSAPRPIRCALILASVGTLLGAHAVGADAPTARGPVAVPSLPQVSSPPPVVIPVESLVSIRAVAVPTGTTSTTRARAASPLAHDARADALTLLAAGRFRAAHAAWRRAARATPDGTAIHEEAARSFAGRRLYDVALGWAREARSIEPSRAELVLLEARIAWTAGHHEQALATASAAAPGAASAELWAFVAALHDERGESALAADAYDQALRLDPSPSDWWIGLAIAAERSARDGAARDAYRQALQKGLDAGTRRFALERLNTLLRRDLP